MSEQESHLKMQCALLREELEDLKESLEGTAALQNSMKANSTVEYTTFNQMITLLDRQDDSKELEKRVSSYESFSLSLVYIPQEVTRRISSFLVFIGAYAGGHPDKLSASLSIFELSPTKSKSPYRVSHGNRRGKERASESFGEWKEDPLATAVLAKLKEELGSKYPTKRLLADIVLKIAAEIGPVRTCSNEALGTAVGEAGEGDERKMAANVLSALVREGSAGARTKAEDAFRNIRVMLDAVSAAKQEVKEAISGLPLTPQQKLQFEQEKAKMRERAQGPPLKDIPEKLAESISSEFEKRVKALAAHKRSDVASSVETARSRTVDDSPISPRGQESDRDASRELEEVALLTSARRLMRLGLSQPDKAAKSDTFIAEKISALSSIRRAADLEKKLLEQVQGVESKLKRIKSRGEGYIERKLDHRGRAPLRLPAIAKSASVVEISRRKPSPRVGNP